MISQNILEKLVCFTDEEIDNLNGINQIDCSIFVDDNLETVDYHHLLEPNQLFAVRKHVRFCKYPIHKHNYVELMYVYGGSMTHIIDNKKVTINEGEILLLNQNIKHGIEYCDENDIIFNFIIRPEFFQFISTMLQQNNDVSRFIFDALYSYNDEEAYLVFKVKEYKKVKQYIESIITNLYEKHLNGELELKLLVGLLLTELMNHPECIESYTVDSYEKILISMILKYICLNYKDGTLMDLCKTIHQPNYKVCKLIKKQTGKTFTQLLQEEKLKNAEQLLKNSTMSLNDIIVAIGYENISYFYRLFKNKYMMTPLEYRKKNKLV